MEENYDFKESQNISILNNNRLVKKTSFSSLIKPENLLFYVNNQIISNNYEKNSSQIISIIFEIIKPNLIFNEDSRTFNIKKSDKHGNTLKSLAPKKNKTQKY